MLPVAWPLLDADGRAGKVLVAGLRLDWFAERYAEKGIGLGQIAIIWDREGRVLFRDPDPEKLSGTLRAGTPLFEAARRAGGTGVVETPGFDGVRRIYAFSSSPALADLGLTLAFGESTATLAAEAHRALRHNLALLALLAAVILALAWWNSEVSLRRPLARLVEASARLRAGDLKVRIAGPHPGGEIGALMIGLNEAAAALEAQTETLRRSNRALRMSSECNQALVRAGDESQLLADICERIVRFGGYRFAWVGYAEDDAAKSVRPVARAGFDEGYLEGPRITWADDEYGRGPVGTAIRSGRPFVAADIASDPRFAPWRDAALACGYASCIGLPLFVEGRAIGALNIYAAESGAFHDEELPLLVELAGDLAYGIAALRSQSERKRAEQEILDLNATLEQRIAERTQQLEEASRAKSDFLANMSHELRTPLNSIIGFSEMLKDGVLGELTAKQRGFIGDIYGAGTHLLSLVNDILDLSKVEAGMLQLDAGAVDLPALLQASTLVVREKAFAHRIRLDTRLDPALGTVLADERKLKQIVYNLLANAVKFTPEGGTVTLSARRCTRAAARAPRWHPMRDPRRPCRHA